MSAATEISITEMTLSLMHEFYQHFQNDPDIYMDIDLFSPYCYVPEKIDAQYRSRQLATDRKDFIIMHAGRPIGEICLKHIDYERKQAELSIHLQCDAVKNRGFGTEAEKLLIAYAFDVLGLNTVTANSVLKNTRSQHVLEKVGFKFVRQEDIFRYYQFTREKYDPIGRNSL